MYTLHIVMLFYEPNSDPKVRQSSYDKRKQWTNIHDDDQNKIF